MSCVCALSLRFYSSFSFGMLCCRVLLSAVLTFCQVCQTCDCLWLSRFLWFWHNNLLHRLREYIRILVKLWVSVIISLKITVSITLIFFLPPVWLFPSFWFSSIFFMPFPTNTILEWDCILTRMYLLFLGVGAACLSG